FSDPGPVFHTIVSIKNDGHYFCRAGGNRPDGLNEPVTNRESNKLKGRLNVVVIMQKNTSGFLWFSLLPD
ncbi:hypothetical protein, partial [Escherichia coli]|uniref:hypothetical protein n=1 Tax=Escherichia coli TaxID=562 RepID=UPI0021BF4FE5